MKCSGYDTAFIGKWHMPGSLPKLEGVDPFITFTIQGGQGRYLNCPIIVNGEERPSRKPYITEELTDYAIEFIERERDAPFCLYLSHKAVHHRWTPPAHLADIYADKKPPFPKGFDPWIPVTRGHLFEGTNQGFASELYRNYCRTIVALDEQLGRLLDRLGALGLEDNTLVVFAGDNGFFWGEHELFGTGRWPYDDSIRVPSSFGIPGRFPTQEGGRIRWSLNIDVAPTFLEVAGVPVPEDMEGSSFLPILRSASAPGREAFLYEYFKDFPYRIPRPRASERRSTCTSSTKAGGSRNSTICGTTPCRTLMNTAEGKAPAAELPKDPRVAEERKRRNECRIVISLSGSSCPHRSFWSR